MANMDVPAEIQALLDDYIALMQNNLPDLIEACYVHGSIALGGFDAFSTDVDFVTIINRQCTESDLSTLADIHHAIAHKYPQWILDGCYLQSEDLGKSDADIAPYPQVNDHVFHSSGHMGMHGVMWWILKHHGIAILGKDPKSLDICVDMDDLIIKMRQNLNSYWGQYTRSYRHILMLYSDYGVQWTVLGVLRQFYTFRERSIVSKAKAGHYALDCLPQKWHRLIQEALNIRQKKTDSLYRWRLGRMINTFNFVRYVIDTCNADSTENEPQP